MKLELTELSVFISKLENWSVKYSEGEEYLTIKNEDGVEAYLAVSGEQIVVEVILFSEKEVKDINVLNAEILRTHQIFPLSTIGINDILGESYYVAFGALSSQSKEETVVIEISTLFRNVEAFIELYNEHLER